MSTFYAYCRNKLVSDNKIQFITNLKISSKLKLQSIEFSMQPQELHTHTHTAWNKLILLFNFPHYQQIIKSQTKLQKTYNLGKFILETFSLSKCSQLLVRKQFPGEEDGKLMVYFWATQQGLYRGQLSLLYFSAKCFLI